MMNELERKLNSITSQKKWNTYKKCLIEKILIKKKFKYASSCIEQRWLELT